MLIIGEMQDTQITIGTSASSLAKTWSLADPTMVQGIKEHLKECHREAYRIRKNRGLLIKRLANFLGDRSVTHSLKRTKKNKLKTNTRRCLSHELSMHWAAVGPS